MAFTLPRALQEPDWFTWFRAKADRTLNAADQQNIKFLRKDFTKADANTTLSLGAIPANATILAPISGAEIHEVFNAATTNTFGMGTAASTTLYGTGKPLTALGFVPLTAAVSYHPSDTLMTEIKATVTTTGAAATTGKGCFVIAYLVAQEV